MAFDANPRPIPVTIDGLRDPASMISARVIADVADEILFIEPKASPLTAISGAINKKQKATQYRVDWLEKDPYPRKVTVSGAQTSGDTAIELVAGQGIRVPTNGVYLNLRTREQILVTLITTDTLTVVRGIGGYAAAMNDTDELLLTRQVFPDGARSGDMKSVQERDEFNYCEITRTKVGWTGRQVHTSLYGGKDPSTERRAASIEHMKSIEMAFLFGRRFSRTAASGKLQTFMGGLENYITSNVWDLAGTEPTLRAFEEFLEVVMQYGPNGKRFGSGKKMFFCSDRWLTVFDTWKDGKLDMRPIDDSLDIKVAEIVTSHGTLLLVPEPILTDDHAGWGFVLDMGALTYRYHEGRDTKLLENREDNDADQVIEEYFSDICLQVAEEMAHGIVKGLPTT